MMSEKSRHYEIRFISLSLFFVFCTRSSLTLPPRQSDPATASPSSPLPLRLSSRPFPLLPPLPSPLAPSLSSFRPSLPLSFHSCLYLRHTSIFPFSSPLSVQRRLVLASSLSLSFFFSSPFFVISSLPFSLLARLFFVFPPFVLLLLHPHPPHPSSLPVLFSVPLASTLPLPFSPHPFHFSLSVSRPSILSSPVSTVSSELHFQLQ